MRDEAIVNFKNDAVGETGNDHRLSGLARNAFANRSSLSRNASSARFRSAMSIKVTTTKTTRSFLIMDRRGINGEESLCSIAAPISHLFALDHIS